MNVAETFTPYTILRGHWGQIWRSTRFYGHYYGGASASASDSSCLDRSLPSDGTIPGTSSLLNCLRPPAPVSVLSYLLLLCEHNGEIGRIVNEYVRIIGLQLRNCSEE